MQKGRYAPPPVIVTTPRADDPSQAIDAAFFKANPKVTEYQRRFIPGESFEDMHPDTIVVVRRVGRDRLRGFAPPNVGRAN
jgi:hypothetical protein